MLPGAGGRNQTYTPVVGNNRGLGNYGSVTGGDNVAASVANAHIVGANERVLVDAVAALNAANRKANTAAAYDSKSLEWNEFCDHAYVGEPLSIRYAVNGNKLGNFLRYHAFRNKRKQGGRKRGARSAFDSSEYDRILSEMSEHIRQMQANPDYVIPDPDNPIGYDQMNTYTSTVYNIYAEQRRCGANGLSWDMIRNEPNVAEVLNMVKRRKGLIKWARHDEKLDEQFQPFQSLEQVPRVEQFLWDYGNGGDGGTNRKSAFVGLRTRMTFLWCYSGVLRSESIFLGELSDLFDFGFERDDHSDVMDVVVLQMRTGKTVDNGIAQYGRAMRHKEVTLCAVGALSMYLMYRFDYSGEMEDCRRPDFLDNSAWFDIKLLTDGTCNNTKEMGTPSYTNVMAGCFKSLAIFSNWLSHWGRHYASAAMEMMDCPEPQQERLGKS